MSISFLTVAIFLSLQYLVIVSGRPPATVQELRSNHHIKFTKSLAKDLKNLTYQVTYNKIVFEYFVYRCSCFLYISV